MSNLVDVGKIDELTDGTMKMVMVNEHEIMLARVGGKYYAAANRCPHMGGKLSQGKLEGTIVTCPRHGSRFDISNGHVVSWIDRSGLIWKVGRALKAPQPLTTYNVQIEDNKILIGI